MAEPEEPEIIHLPPHEEDDPWLQDALIAADYDADTSAGASILMGTSGTASNTPTMVTFHPGSTIPVSTISIPPVLGVVVEGASLSAEHKDGDFLLKADGGSTGYFSVNPSSPLNIDGNKRMFKMTRDEAQSLVVQLARLLSETAE